MTLKASHVEGPIRRSRDSMVAANVGMDTQNSQTLDRFVRQGTERTTVYDAFHRGSTRQDERT